MRPTGLRILLTYLTIRLILAPVYAQSPPPANPLEQQSLVTEHIASVQVGIDGLHKLGQWTHVRVTLASPTPKDAFRLDMYVHDSEGIPVAYAGSPTVIGSSQVSSFDFLIKLGRLDRRAELVASAGQATLWREALPSSTWPAPVASGQQVVLNLGSDLGISTALGMRSANGRERILTHHVSKPHHLPTHWLGYSSVDVIVLPTGDSSWTKQMEKERWSALQKWVEQGGYLLVSGATNSELFQNDGPLAWCTAANVQGTLRIRQTSGIEQYIGATSRLDQSRSSDGETFELKMLDLRDPEGRVEVWEGLVNQRYPAIVRSVVGLGRVTLMGLDIDRAPFSTWNDRPKLLARLLEPGLDEPLDETLFGVETGPVAHLGYTDIVGQLRRALDQFPNVRFIAFSWIAGLVLAYLAMIGPIDFWILKKLQRPHWTWISAPVIVLSFVGMIWWFAAQWKGSRLRINQMTVVDVDASRGIVRGTSWHHLFSPYADRTDVQLQPSTDLLSIGDLTQVLSWQGLPGKGFGGLERTESLGAISTPYRIHLPSSTVDKGMAQGESSGEIEGLPLAIWSSRSLLGQWWGTTRFPESQTQLRLGSESLVTGVVQNPLSHDLRDAVLIYDRWAYPLGNLPAGGLKPIEEVQQFDLQDLQTFLTDRRVVDGRSVTDPWDQQSADVARIAQLMFFYQAAEGQGYARLQHRYQRWLDWTDHVRQQRAVLWGRVNMPGSQLRIDNQETPADHDWTFCRILLPVQSEGGPSS